MLKALNSEKILLQNIMSLIIMAANNCRFQSHSLWYSKELKELYHAMK